MSIGVDVNWKKIVAKEWIWFICVAGGVLLVWSIINPVFSSGAIFIEVLLNSYDSNHEEAKVMTIVPICLVYFIRLTVWGIKELRKKEAGNK